MNKHCTYLQKNSKSVFMKTIAQTETISLLLPNYTLTWEHPIEADVLFLLDTLVNPVYFGRAKQDVSWLKGVPVIECMPGTGGTWSRILDRDVLEVYL